VKAQTLPEVHILFTGHNGSGKSTEMNRLAADLKNQFFIVRQSPNIFDLTYIDLVLGMAVALFRRATESDVLGTAPAHIVNKVWANISQFIEKAFFGLPLSVLLTIS
jgi:energy-coupling factor transporter ATP-binding protein EcfA2